MALTRKRAALTLRAAAMQAAIAALGSVLVVDDAAAAHSADPATSARPTGVAQSGPRAVAGPRLAGVMSAVHALLRAGKRTTAWTAADTERARVAERAARAAGGTASAGNGSLVQASSASLGPGGGKGPAQCGLGIKRPVVVVLGGGPAALERQV